jgi:ABC-type polar amino acid transport system ATPase subunit
VYVLDDIDKSYSRVIVFSGLSCKIPTDRFVFVIGPSGSGKSTLLRLLSFVDPPDKGSIELSLDGATFSSDDAKRPWPKVTCVFQRQFLWPHLTIRENIVLPLRILQIPEGGARLAEVVDLLGMKSFLDRYPNEVSGGEAQRAALGRAFVLKPSVILIDEVHGGLDLEQQTTVNQYLLRLRETGVGLVVVTHSVSFARKYADVLLVVENQGITTIADARDPGRHIESPFLKRVLEL